ncbi:MAG: T9SS type A sorting domain-containing protein [Chitinophagales bacterium]
MINRKKIQAKKLAQYTAASAAFLALQNEADAQVIYRDLEPDSIITSDDTILLDLNLDSINDVMFWIESQAGNITTSLGGMYSYLYRFARVDALGYNVLPGDQGTYSGYVFRDPYQFSSGELIGYSDPEYFAGSAILGGAIFVNSDTVYSAGPWSGVDGKFLGLRFRYDGYHHWAWMRLKVGEGGSSVTVYDLAYVTSADAAIPAGFTTETESEIIQNKPHIFSAGLNIHINFTTLFSGASFSIFDLSGKQLKTGNIIGTSTTISCSNFPAGIYILKVSDGKDVFEQKVFLGG